MSSQNGPSISAPSGKSHAVIAADGETIEIPLSYLAECSYIEVVGEAPKKPGPVKFGYVVNINNYFTLNRASQHKLNQSVVNDVENARKFAAQKASEDLVGKVMKKRGVQKKLAGAVRNKVHNPLNSKITKIGKSIGLRNKSSQAITNSISKSISKGVGATAGFAGKKILGRALSFFIGGGVGIAHLILSSDEIGYSAVKYGQSKDKSFPVIFYIDGKPRGM